MSVVNVNPMLLAVLGTQEMVIILIMALLLFGGKKIPELMKVLGKGMNDFNYAKTTVSKEIKEGFKLKLDSPIV